MTRKEEREQASVDYQISTRPVAIGGYAFGDMVYRMNINHSFIAGAEWADSHAWKPADGDDLPEIDKEVVVLYQHYPLDVDEYSVGFAHRPPEYWDGKNIGTGVVTRYYPKKYGKGGWSSPDVKWWLDLDLPKPKVEE